MKKGRPENKERTNLIQNLARNGLNSKQIAKTLRISRQAVEYQLSKKISK